MKRLILFPQLIICIIPSPAEAFQNPDPEKGWPQNPPPIWWQLVFCFMLSLSGVGTSNSIGNSPSKSRDASNGPISSLVNSRQEGFPQKWRERGEIFLHCMTNATFLRRRQKADDSLSAFVSYYSISLLTYGWEVLPLMKPWPAEWSQPKLFSSVKLPALESEIQTNSFHLENTTDTGWKGKALCMSSTNSQVRLSKNNVDKVWGVFLLFFFIFLLNIFPCSVICIIQSMAVNFWLCRLLIVFFRKLKLNTAPGN